MAMNGSTVIARPAEEIYAYVIDVSNDVNWRTGVERSGLRSDPPIGVGSIGYVAVGDAEATYEVTVVVPNERVDWELKTGPYQGFGGYRFEPVEGGTRFTLVARDVKPTGALKLLGPVFGWIARRQNQADVEKLRDILES